MPRGCLEQTAQMPVIRASEILSEVVLFFPPLPLMLTQLKLIQFLCSLHDGARKATGLKSAD